VAGQSPTRPFPGTYLCSLSVLSGFSPVKSKPTAPGASVARMAPASPGHPSKLLSPRVEEEDYGDGIVADVALENALSTFAALTALTANK
jgi:hypothetical protein